VKRPRREGGGGEVALMAVITKAMGAFLVLVVIMLPDYIYVVQHGTQGSGAQQILDAASQQVQQLEQALNGAAGPPKDLTAMRKVLQDLEQKLGALKDEVASLSRKLGQADAEIARLTDIGVSQGSKQDERARQAVDAASQALKQLEQAFNAANATPQDRAAIRQTLQDLEQKLATSKDEIASLADRLRQAGMVIARLKQENADLKAQANLLQDQIAKLKADEEALRKRPLSATLVTLAWSGCYGADIELYVQVKVGDRSAPAVDRTLTTAKNFEGDQPGPHFQPNFSTSMGTTWWTLTDIDADQRFTLWAKLLNPFYGQHSIPRVCKTNFTITTSTGKAFSTPSYVTDNIPVRLLSIYDVDATSGLSDNYWAKLTDGEFLTLSEAPFKQPCEGLLCLFDVYKSAPRPDAEIRPRFVEYVRDNYDIEEDVIGAVFDRMASGEMSVEDGYRWLGLFPRTKASKVEASTPEDLAALRRALEHKGAPGLLTDALMKRVEASLERAGTLTTTLEAMPAFTAPTPPATSAPTAAPAQNLTGTPTAVRDRLVDLASQSVKNGELTQAQSDAILAAASHSSKPSDAEINKWLDGAHLPPPFAELLKQLIKSGDFDINALPTTPSPTPSPAPSSFFDVFKSTTSKRP
jgi:archaellum component FlaC